MECYKVDAKILPRPLPDFIFDAIEVWKHDFKIDEVDKFQRDGKFIANPIKIILEPGEYAITQVIRVYTIADFSIIGPEEKEDEEEKVAIIEFSRNYEYNGAIFTYYEIDSKGSNCLACFSSPTANEQVPAFKKDNCFKLQNLTLRMRDGSAEGGLFYPFIDKFDEVMLGVLITYANFHKAEIVNLNIKATKQGEISLIEGDTCDHHIITDCYLYLNNWHERTDNVREQGANMNIRGSHKSALITRNTFIKHGCDEALTFLEGYVVKSDKTFRHENIRVIKNSFTYLDAEPEPVIVTPTNDMATDTDTGGVIEPIIIRPVHVNGVLVSFAPTTEDECNSIWKNVLFAENNLYLQGPVVTAVSMHLIRNDQQCDEYDNVEFANNCLYHTYRHNGLRPGNGAVPYVYSNSFMFAISSSFDSLVPDDDDLVYEKDPSEETGTVSYYGNTITYSQRTQDDQGTSDYAWAADHACFNIYGGNVNIHDNVIDGSKAIVKRGVGSQGLYGKIDKPVTLLHCNSCSDPGPHSIKMYNNEAVGYGVVLRCSNQYADDTYDTKKISNYKIYIEGNSFYDGAGMALVNLDKSQLSVVQNRFYECTQNFMFDERFLSEVRISVCQNMFDSDKQDSDYSGKLFLNEGYSQQAFAQLVVFANCLNGYTSGSMNSVSDAVVPNSTYNCAGNLYASKE